jgi:hypothetical protein
VLPSCRLPVPAQPPLPPCAHSSAGQPAYSHTVHKQQPSMEHITVSQCTVQCDLCMITRVTNLAYLQFTMQPKATKTQCRATRDNPDRLCT